MNELRQIDVRTAILEAADYIEANPNYFDFMSVWTPKEHTCGSPGCAIGWINHFANNRIGKTIGCSEEVNAVLGVTPDKFYKRMDGFLMFSSDWRYNAKYCARRLRRYANKFHPAKPSKELKSGSEVAREIMSRKFDEKEFANA